MKEVDWFGTIALLDTPTVSGKILPKYAYNSWIPLPIILWNDGQPAGILKGISVLETRIIAHGTASQGQLVGRLMTGKPVHVSPNIKFTADRNEIVAITVVSKAVWEGVNIRKK